jgi:hypothetical protein
LSRTDEPFVVVFGLLELEDEEEEEDEVEGEEEEEEEELELAREARKGESLIIWSESVGWGRGVEESMPSIATRRGETSQQGERGRKPERAKEGRGGWGQGRRTMSPTFLAWERYRGLARGLDEETGRDAHAGMEGRR